jgi:hypothetical protein
MGFIDPFVMLNGVLGVAGAYILYMVVRHGGAWVLAKATSIWGTVKDDVTAAERFLNVQNDVNIIKADLVVVKQKLGL